MLSDPIRRARRLCLAWIVFAAGCVAPLAGCGDGRPPRVAVSGRVTIDGEPLTYGFVQFRPTGGRMSVGQLDSEGRFELACYGADDGALLGKHRVAVKAKESLNATTVKWHAPKRYASFSTSGLEQTISGSTDAIKVELTWAGNAGPRIQSLR